MTIWEMAFSVAGLGAIGGFVNCFHSVEIRLPRMKESRVWDPGFIGKVVVGAAAAILVWLFYSPLVNLDQVVILKQLGSSIGIGFSGGKILTLWDQRDAERLAKETLAKELEKFKFPGQ
jgi:hypothetical protein